jgi:argininosuccinate lyase
VKIRKRSIFRGIQKRGLTKASSEFISSLKDDSRLFDIDIDVICAHNLMLYRQKILKREELAKILRGLEDARGDKKLRKKITSGISPDPNLYDIHPIIEKYVIEKHGLDVGGKMNIGKSRNDQVATDIRIYLRGECIEISESLLEFANFLVRLAKKYRYAAMPGYTHGEPAQVITYGHYLLCYSSSFMQNFNRLLEVYERINLNPLGACALAGSSIPIDRFYTARLLGFRGVVENSIEAVSNRDFMLEMGANLVTIMFAQQNGKGLHSVVSYRAGHGGAIG